MRERIWQALAKCYSAAMAPLTPRARYRVTLAIARSFARIVGPALMKRPSRYAYSTLPEETLRALLRAMSRKGMLFEPELRVDAPGDALETLRRGAILLTAHFPLNALATRFITDAGIPNLVIRGNPTGDEYIWGTTQRSSFVLPNATILLKVRRLVAQKWVVAMAIDRSAPYGRTVAIESQFGIYHLSTVVFRFAERLGIPLFFFCARMNDQGEAVVIVRPIDGVESYAACLNEQTGALLR